MRDLSSRRTLRLASFLARTLTAAVEDKIRLLTQKYKIDEDDVKRLLKIDPTGGSYLEWLVRRWDRGEITGWSKSQNYQIRQLLTTFSQIKKSTRLLQGASADINRYTVQTLGELISRVTEAGDLQSRRQKEKDSKSAGSQLVYDDGHIKIIQIGGEGVDLDQAAHAACLYAYGTKWCTSAMGTSQRYLMEAPLYVIFRDGTKVAQYSPRHSGDLQDTVDDHLSPYNKEHVDIFNALVQSGIPIPEEFLGELIGARIDLPESALARIRESPRLAFLYARDYLRGRWPEGEHAIVQDPFFGGKYAEDILKSRWPEYEKNLLREVSTSFPYSRLTGAIKDYTRAFFPRGWPEMNTAWDRKT